MKGRKSKKEFDQGEKCVHMKRILIWFLIFCLTILGGCSQNSNESDRQSSDTNITDASDDTADYTNTENNAGDLSAEDDADSTNIKNADHDTDIENDTAPFQDVEHKIQSDIDNGFPGAVLLVAKDGEIIYFKAFGYAKKYDQKVLLAQPTAMKPDTLFDLASLTKIYATTFSIMKLYDEGKIHLDDTVSQYLPQFDKSPYNKITIRHLLTHTSGLPADYPFYKTKGELFSRDKEKTINFLDNVPLSSGVGEKQVYSDLGFMIAGAIVETITGQPLDSYARETIYNPLGIASSITYQPTKNGIDQQNIACTECRGNTRGGSVWFDGIRTATLQGEVHDEKAYYSMDGISGHAGLFGNAQAINTLNQVLLNKGSLNGVQLFSGDTVNTFASVYNGMRYQLAFANAKTNQTLSPVVSNRTFYHTGWTGTFSLFDLDRNLSVVLLTNKRHSPFINQQFQGSAFDTGQYYSIVRMVYDSMM